MHTYPAHILSFNNFVLPRILSIQVQVMDVIVCVRWEVNDLNPNQ